MLNVPLNTMMLSMVIQLLLGFFWFGSTAAFNVFSGVGVTTLIASYAVLIAISLFTGRKAIKTAKSKVGYFGAVANTIALGRFLATALRFLRD